MIAFITMKINTVTVPDSTRILCLLTLFILLFPWYVASGIQPGYQFNGKHKSTQFTFQLVENLIIIPITINNDLTLRFILDSGTRTPIILNSATIKHLALPRGRSVTFTGRGLKKVAQGYTIHNIKLELPGVVANGMSMVVLEKDYLKMKNFPIAVHGVIGYGIFSRFVVDIDYKNQLIRLHDPVIYRPGPHLNTLAFEIHDTKPYIKSLLTISKGKNVEAMLLIDTGAGTGLILEAHSDPLIASSATKKRKFIGRGLGGKIFCHQSQISRLQLGNYALADIEAPITSQDNPARYKTHGSIGGKTLSQFERVIFNYTNRQLYLKKRYPVNSLVMTTDKIVTSSN